MRVVKATILLGRTLSNASGGLHCLEEIMPEYVHIQQFVTWRQMLVTDNQGFGWNVIRKLLTRKFWEEAYA